MMKPASTNETLSVANQLALAQVYRYLKLRVGDFHVPCPYFSNDVYLQIRDVLNSKGVGADVLEAIQDTIKTRKACYGWSAGKAMPEELEGAIPELIERSGLHKGKVTPYGVLELMKLKGLGVDCSGFVFNILFSTLKQLKLEGELIESLAWQGDERDVFHAGSATFNFPASTIIPLSDVSPLDIILIKEDSKILHIALVVFEHNQLLVAQSSLSSNPSGVTLVPFHAKNDEVLFDLEIAIGRYWDDLYRSGKLTFNRLACLRSLHI